MRLFTAIDLPEASSLRLEQLLSKLRPLAAVKWTSVPNLHITTKFLGEVPAERLAAIEAALQPVHTAAFWIALKAFGWFPSDRAPRVLYLRLEGGPELASLAAQTEDALTKVGIAKENRAFSPHLTLARIPDKALLQPLRERMADISSDSFGRFQVSRFFLYQSEPGPKASVYRKLREYDLQTTASTAGAC